MRDSFTLQSIMNFGGFIRQASRDNDIMDSSLRKKSSLWYSRSLRSTGGRQLQSAEHKVCKPKQTWTNALIDFSDPQRSTVLLEKQDNEAFGFEIQTYGLQLKSSSVVVLCTFVSSVQEHSAAEEAGLTAGDVIITINGASIEGLSHQRVLGLIRDSINTLKMETVCGNVVKWIKLEKRMKTLERSLSEKVMELQALTLQEQRLLRGHLNDGPDLSSDSSEIPSSPKSRFGRRFSSAGSFGSMMTDDSDLGSVFGDPNSPAPCSANGTAQDNCFFSGEFRASSSSRSSSRSRISSCSGHRHWFLSSSGASNAAGSSSSSSSSCSSSPVSPPWDETRISSLFGTLPRKARRPSIRKHILKLLPGLQRSVEEDETGAESQ